MSERFAAPIHGLLSQRRECLTQLGLEPGDAFHQRLAFEYVKVCQRSDTSRCMTGICVAVTEIGALGAFQNGCAIRPEKTTAPSSRYWM